MTTAMKIMIGYDGSECADAAIDDLSFAGLPNQTEVQILSVAELWLPPPPPSSYEIVEQARDVQVPADLQHVYAKHSQAATEALRVAEKAAERIRSIYPNWKVTANSSCGSAAAEIISQAREWKPDLIVVGSHGRTAFGRLVLGSVSQRLLVGAPCSVRIARGRVEEPNTPVKLIVGVDGSPSSESAVRALARRNWPAGSEVVLMVVDALLFPDFVGKVIPPLSKIIEEDKREEIEWATRIASKAARHLAESNLKVSEVLRSGEPKIELPKAAEEWRADCIFVGSAGFSNRFERLVLGSVSAAVAARAHCSVEVVRE